jgi:hypothetical protein
MEDKPNQSTPDSRKGPGHGGKRAGAGRPMSEATKLRAEYKAATAGTLIEWLPEILGNLKRLADGGYERAEEKHELRLIVPPAGTTDEAGKPLLPYEAMVLVERKVSIADADRSANQYLMDRLLGRPTQAVELTGEDGEAIRSAVQIYLPHNGRENHAGDPTAEGPTGDVAG